MLRGAAFSIACFGLCLTASAQSAIANGAQLSGNWTCNMEHAGDGLVLKMTGHTTFASDGRYSATGLGVVHFDNPDEQVRWVATSSGWYDLDGVALSYSGLRIEPRPLPPLGMEGRSIEDVEDLYASIVGSIENEPEGPQTSEILSLDSRQLVIRTDGDNLIWNCQRPTGDF